LLATPDGNFEPSGAGANRARKNANPASPGQTVYQNIEPFGAPELSTVFWGVGDQKFNFLT